MVSFIWISCPVPLFRLQFLPLVPVQIGFLSQICFSNFLFVNILFVFLADTFVSFFLVRVFL